MLIRIRGPQDCCLLSKVNILNGRSVKALGYHMDGWKYPIHPDIFWLHCLYTRIYVVIEIDFSTFMVVYELIRNVEMAAITPLAREKEATLMLPLVWIMVLLHIRVGLHLDVILKWASWELKGPNTIACFPRWIPWMTWTCWLAPISPEGKLLGHMVGWNYLVHFDPPTMMGWTIGGRVHR